MDPNHDRVWNLLMRLDTCMLVTHANGRLRGRPMSSLPDQDDGKIYFLTDRTSGLDEEVADNSDVLLAYGDNSAKFVAVNGTARLNENRDLIASLWNTGAQAFWPKGPEDPDVIAVEVLPTRADLWDGASGIVASAKMAYALATGSKPDLGERKQVQMP